MFGKKTIRDLDVTGKHVLVRVDFNVPIDEKGKVIDDTRIKATLPTIDYLRTHCAKIILVSHLGRPKGVDDKFRLDPVAKRLSELIGVPVKKVDKTVTEEVLAAVNALNEGEILMLENVRFNEGEKTNDPFFAQKLAALADIYVNDAFGASHRAHASTAGVAHYLPAVSGFLLEKEIGTLSRLTEKPKKPFVAILGGNKVSDKIGVIENFLNFVDVILTGGSMCFTFLKAKGLNIGSSILQEKELEHCAKMLKKAEQMKKKLLLPVDVVVADSFSEDANHKVVPVEEIPEGWMGLDIGPKTISLYKEVMEGAKTIFWNGPMGVFEMEPFSTGTKEVAETLANLGATTIVGGGDSDAALRKYSLEDKVTFVSTGGGASLSLLEGTKLPGVEALMDK